MVEWLKSLPKTAFVALVLTVGVLYIVLSDPPKNICDAQIEQFETVNRGLLTLDPKKPTKRVSRFKELIELCRSTKSAGGCYELFGIVKVILKNARLVEPACYSKLADQDDFKNAVWSSLDMLVRLAWGEHPPATANQRQGWLDGANLNLFCSLKSTATNVFGKSDFENFQETYFTSLPETNGLQRAEVWSKMIFSVNCANYL